MAWSAATEQASIDVGTVVHIDRGTSESPPQKGETIALSHGEGRGASALTVVSAAADRLEVTDGRRNHVLKPHAETKPNILDADGHYRDAWIVA